jgi:DNA invertase Pin-like site-specific DNA recombinase
VYWVNNGDNYTKLFTLLTYFRHPRFRLDAGDVLMVTRLDRLARSTRDLLNTLASITDKGAGFRSIGDTWLIPRARTAA